MTGCPWHRRDHPGDRPLRTGHGSGLGTLCWVAEMVQSKFTRGSVPANPCRSDSTGSYGSRRVTSRRPDGLFERVVRRVDRMRRSSTELLPPDRRPSRQTIERRHVTENHDSWRRHPDPAADLGDQHLHQHTVRANPPEHADVRPLRIHLVPAHSGVWAVQPMTASPHLAEAAGCNKHKKINIGDGVASAIRERPDQNRHLDHRHLGQHVQQPSQTGVMPRWQRRRQPHLNAHVGIVAPPLWHDYVGPRSLLVAAAILAGGGLISDVLRAAVDGHRQPRLSTIGRGRRARSRRPGRRALRRPRCPTARPMVARSTWRLFSTTRTYCK